MMTRTLDSTETFHRFEALQETLNEKAAMKLLDESVSEPYLDEKMFK